MASSRVRPDLKEGQSVRFWMTEKGHRFKVSGEIWRLGIKWAHVRVHYCDGKDMVHKVQPNLIEASDGR